MKTKSMLDAISWLILVCQMFLSGVIMFTASVIPLRWSMDGTPSMFVAPWHILWVLLAAILLFAIVTIFERRYAGRAAAKGDAVSLTEDLLAWAKMLSLFVLLYITWIAYSGGAISFVVPGVAFLLLLVVFGVYDIRYSRS